MLSQKDTSGVKLDTYHISLWVSALFGWSPVNMSYYIWTLLYCCYKYIYTFYAINYETFTTEPETKHTVEIAVFCFDALRKWKHFLNELFISHFHSNANYTAQSLTGKKHVMNQTVEAKVQCDEERGDARGCDSPTYRVPLPGCLCHHTDAAEEVFDSAGRGSWGVAKNILMASAWFNSVFW